MNTWQLQEAKNRLSHVLREAKAHGPQVITSHGREAGVVLSPEDYLALIRPKSSLVDFFRTSPLLASGIEIERPTEPGGVMDL